MREKPDGTGRLFVVATPIGHLGDVSMRMGQVLGAADVVLCEDTRTSRPLLNHLGANPKMLAAYHEHNGPEMRPKVLAWLGAGLQVALISDAGTPLISDPGYKLVREAQDAGFEAVAVPGPSSVTAALSVCGLPTDRFLFAGFLPSKSAARQKELLSLGRAEVTLVVFESAKRLTGLLADIASVLGEREVALCRELTKRFEEVRRLPVTDLIASLAEKPAKGECVVVIAPAEAETTLDSEALLRAALKNMHVGDAARHVAALTGEARKTLYERAMRLKDEK